MFLEKQAQNIQREISNLVTAIAKGTPPEYVNPEIEILKGELAKIINQKDSLQKIRPPARSIDEEKMIKYFCRLDDIMNNGTNREKRQFIRSFIRKLEFDPEQSKVTIHWYHDPLKKL